jgi:hypothetical protein
VREAQNSQLSKDSNASNAVLMTKSSAVMEVKYFSGLEARNLMTAAVKT